MARIAIQSRSILFETPWTLNKNFGSINFIFFFKFYLSFILTNTYLFLTIIYIYFTLKVRHY